MILPMVLFCWCSVLVNILLANYYLQSRSDSAWRRKQEEADCERRLQRVRKEAEDLRRFERAFEHLATKAAAFECDLFGLAQSAEMQVIWEAIEHDPSCVSRLLPEAHRPFYARFALLQNVIGRFIERMEQESSAHEEILFFEDVLTDLWQEYRLACNRDHLQAFRQEPQGQQEL